MRDKTRSRPTRLIAVSVLGLPAQRSTQNERRFELLNEIIYRLKRKFRGEPLDAVLLPAGFLRSADHYGDLPQWARVDQLSQASYGEGLLRAARKLDRTWPGILLVAGIDTNKPYRSYRGDQLVVVLNSDGPLGVIRKIFPVKGDTSGAGRAPMLFYAEDARIDDRVFDLPSGASALISVCYDGFLWCERVIGPTDKRRALKNLVVSGSVLARPDADSVDRLLEQLQPPRVGPSLVHLVALHLVWRPGAEIYWQRHGIAPSSAALGGALVVGGAHFVEGLPSNWTASPLASVQAPRTTLLAGNSRRAHTFAPTDGFVIGPEDWPTAMVRLFVQP